MLGRFGSNGITLNQLVALTHSKVRVSFDFYALVSWDGNGPANGQDTFRVSINGTNVLNATFSNIPAKTQSYPQNVPASNAAMTGSIETAPPTTRGYARYRISIEHPHTTSTQQIRFVGLLTEGLGDESWAIDNVLVESMP